MFGKIGFENNVIKSLKQPFQLNSQVWLVLFHAMQSLRVTLAVQIYVIQISSVHQNCFFCPLLYQSSSVPRICITRTIPAKLVLAKTKSVSPSYAIKTIYSGHTAASTLNIILLQNGVVLSLSCLKQFLWTKWNLSNWYSLKVAVSDQFGTSHF